MTCRVLGICRSGLLEVVRRAPSARQAAGQALTATIAQIHHGSRATYGALRVRAELCLGLGVPCGQSGCHSDAHRRAGRGVSAAQTLRPAAAGRPRTRTSSGAGQPPPALTGSGAPSRSTPPRRLRLSFRASSTRSTAPANRPRMATYRSDEPVSRGKLSSFWRSGAQCPRRLSSECGSNGSCGRSVGRPPRSRRSTTAEAGSIRRAQVH